MEIRKMERKQKDLKVVNLSQICGDGSCGCGCEELEETENSLSLENIQEIRSSGDRSLKTPRNSTKK
jgi:hypothetical protein